MGRSIIQELEFNFSQKFPKNYHFSAPSAPKELSPNSQKSIPFPLEGHPPLPIRSLIPVHDSSKKRKNVQTQVTQCLLRQKFVTYPNFFQKFPKFHFSAPSAPKNVSQNCQSHPLFGQYHPQLLCQENCCATLNQENVSASLS